MVEGGWAGQSRKQQQQLVLEGGKGGVASLYRSHFGELEDEDVLGESGSHRLAQIRSYEGRCDAVLSEVEGTLQLLGSIDDAQVNVSDKTSSLHSTCQRLLEEEQELKRSVESLRGPLSYFSELDKLGKLLGMPHIGQEESRGGSSIQSQLPAPATQIHPGSDAFRAALDSVHSCMEHLVSHPEYLEGEIYLVKFETLQARALALVKNQVVRYLEGARKVAAASAPLAGSSQPFETSPVYAKFRSISHRLAEDMALLTDTSSHVDNVTAMAMECEDYYLEVRLALLRPAIRVHLQLMVNERDIVNMARFGAVYFTRLCELETQLHESCGMGRVVRKTAGDAVGSDQGLRAALQALCDELHVSLRPRVLHGNDMDELCELIGVMREELLRGGGTSTVDVSLLRLMQDTQERLIFLAGRRIEADITNFKPEPKDLNYPAMLKSLRGQEVEGASSHVGYETWYPPLRSTLSILTKLYRAVDVVVFEDLAHQAVAACTAALAHGSELLVGAASTLAGGDVPAENRSGSSGLAVTLNQNLFLAKHLLTLREQLAPFEIQFLQSDRRLNFATTKSALRGLLRINSRPGLRGAVQWTRDTLPAVDEIEMDAKRAMEEALRDACNTFISSAANAAVEPIASFLVKARAFRDRSSSTVSDEGGLSGNAMLREQPFAQPPRVSEMLNAAKDALAVALPLARQMLSLWLDNQMTEMTLMNPIRKKVGDSLKELRITLGDCYTGSEFAPLVPSLEALQMDADSL
jgi:hypothetical protein